MHVTAELAHESLVISLTRYVPMQKQSCRTERCCLLLLLLQVWSNSPINQPAELQLIRASYARVAVPTHLNLSHKSAPRIGSGKPRKFSVRTESGAKNKQWAPEPQAAQAIMPQKTPASQCINPTFSCPPCCWLV